MQIHYKQSNFIADFDALCETTDTHSYHGLPYLLYKTAYKLSKQNNFAAYLLGSILYQNYQQSLDNANLFIQILGQLLHEGELYTDKQAFIDQFKTHTKTKLKPTTLLDAKRLGLHPLLVEAIDMADGGIIDIYLSDNRGVKQILFPFGKTDSPDSFYTGRILVKDTETPTLIAGPLEVTLTGTNRQTLETKLGQQICGTTLNEMTGKPATLRVASGNVFLDAPENYKQTKALNYLLDEASKTPKQSPRYLEIEKLICTLSYRYIAIETPDIYEFMAIRNQLADLYSGLTYGYIIDADYTNDPVSATLYTHFLDLALDAYRVICSETFNLNFDEHDNTSKGGVPNTGTDSKVES